MKKLILLSIFISVFGVSFAQNNNIQKIAKLYAQNIENEKKIDKILESDPELKQLLDSYAKLKVKEINNTKEGTRFNFNEEYFKAEALKLKSILSSQNIDGIKSLYYSVINSDYAQDLSFIVLEQMEKAREDLTKEINNLPNPKN